MYKKILVPIDGSELSKKAVDSAVKFASEINAKIIFCNITNSLPLFYYGIGSIFSPESISLYKQQVSSASFEILNTAREVANNNGVKNEIVCFESDEIYTGIIKAAKSQNCDLIFMASHGYGAVESILLGGQTSKVLAYSNIPVLVNK